MRAILTAAVATAVVLAAEPASAASRTYGARGTLAFDVNKLDDTTQIVVPKTGGPYPLIVASHGFSASGKNQLGWAQHFASWGFVVAVPSFPSTFSPNHATNATIIEGLVTSLTGAQAAANKVKPGAFGLEGHSAGGLATTLATAKVTPAAVVLFDPVDAAGAGEAAYGKLCAPTLAIFAGASACNNQADWKSFAATLPGERVSFEVVGSTHCDGENVTRGLCAIGCGGGADVDRQLAYAHYATAQFLAKLSGDAAAAAVLTDAAVKADTELTGAATAASTCTTSTPGSSSSSSSSSGGASSSSSSGSSGTPTTEPTPTADPTTDPSGEGTSGDSASAGEGGCSQTGASAPSLGGLVALLGLALLRRRHARG